MSISPWMINSNYYTIYCLWLILLLSTSSLKIMQLSETSMLHIGCDQVMYAMFEWILKWASRLIHRICMSHPVHMIFKCIFLSLYSLIKWTQSWFILLCQFNANQEYFVHFNLVSTQFLHTGNSYKFQVYGRLFHINFRWAHHLFHMNFL